MVNPGSLKGCDHLWMHIFLFTATLSIASCSDGTDVKHPVALDADAVKAKVLPFDIISAIRNVGFRDGLVVSQISVSVKGGNSTDWAATAIYIAEHSIVNGANCTEVEVYVPNPRGDMPPQLPKELAKVYYAPEPAHCAFSDPGSDPWLIQSSAKAGTLADIEFYDLSGSLLSDKIDDPEKAQEAADQQARKIVIAKYGLPDNWQSDTKNLGLNMKHSRGHFDITFSSNVDSSMSALSDCLEKDGDNRIFRGCYPAELRNR